MTRTQVKILLAVSLFNVLGCTTIGSSYFDSALNDKNRVPASLQIPTHFDSETTVIDAAHNQAEADFLFLKADLESLQGRPVDSLENLKSALVFDPQSATLMQRMAIEYYRKTQFRDAIYWAERAQALAPQRRDLSFLLAGLYSSTKNFEKAEKIYLNLLAKEPADNETMLYLGAVYSEQKNFKKSVEYFSLVTKEKNPSKYLAHFYLARTYIELDATKNLKKAQEELKKSISSKSDFFDSIAMLGQLVQVDKGTDEAYKFYAQMQKTKGPQVKLAELLSQHYIEKGEYDKAYEQLEILDNNADDQIQVKLKMALILIDKKIYDVAIEKLHEILQVAPESDKVRYYLSATYEEKKQFQAAFDQYMLITKESSFFEESRVHAAYLAKLMKRPDQGLKILKDVLKGKVTNIQTFFLAAQFHEDRKEYDNSIEIIRQAQKAFPKNTQAYFYEGTVLDKMNLKSEMLVSMEKALQIEPDNVQAMNYIAFSLAEMNQQLEKAEKLAREAVLKEKNDGFILDTLGWVLFKKGDFLEALKVLEKAHEIQPSVGIIAEHLGDVHRKLKNLSKAKTFFMKASDLELDLSHKKEIEGKLATVEENVKNLNRKPASHDADAKLSESP